MNTNQACQLVKPKKMQMDPVQRMIEEIEERFIKEGPALDCVSDHETYLAVMAKAPFYVCPTHCNDGEQTWWAAAVSKKEYDKWEENVEHQHHPQDEHEHYLCQGAGIQ